MTSEELDGKHWNAIATGCQLDSMELNHNDLAVKECTSISIQYAIGVLEDIKSEFDQAVLASLFVKKLDKKINELKSLLK